MAENDIQVSVGVTGDNVIEQLRAVSNAALKQMAEDFKASSAQMNASLNQVAENTNKVTRETHDTRTAIEGLTDQIKDNFLGALSGMAVGFISVQGAMTVFNKLK